MSFFIRKMNTLLINLKVQLFSRFVIKMMLDMASLNRKGHVKLHINVFFEKFTLQNLSLETEI